MAKDQTVLQSNRFSSLSSLPSSLIQQPIRKQPPHILLILVLGIALLLLTACGPEKSATDDEALLAETQRIAQEFVANGDLEQARSQLSALDVANANLWLILITENAITQNPEAATPLVQLSESLGLESAQIERFAVENNLLEGIAALTGDAAAAVAPVAPVVVAVAPQATSNAGIQTGSATDGEPEVKVLDEAIADDSTPADETNGDVNVADLEAADTGKTTGAAVELPTPTAAPSPASGAAVRATLIMNVRNGPDIAYAIVGSLDDGEEAEIIGKNEAGDWWEVKLADGQAGWVYGLLVETSGDVGAIAVAANIPPPPEPTATPQPVAEAPAPPAEEAPAVDPNAGPHFTLVDKRLWDVYENGGRLDGPSVTCGEKRQLVVEVIDANGAPVNGVVIRAQLGAKEAQITGDKGPGRTEFVLGGGQEVKVEKDAGGRDATSDVAYGTTTHPAEIPIETLIGARYCADAESCPAFQDAPGCWGHYSWTVTFQRNY